MSVMEGVLARAFGRPTGVLGRIGGALMARGNGPTEQHVVGLADLAAGETVVVLGPGPGVGVRAALGEVGAHGRVIAVDPSPGMLAACRRRCADLAGPELVAGDAAHTGVADAIADAVVSVNNVMIWPDRGAGFSELWRVLRPGGRLLVSAHRRWLDGGADRLADEVAAAGFSDVTTWTWSPPTRGASDAVQLRALRRAAGSGPSDYARSS